MRPKCRNLRQKYKDYEFIQDVESYFTLWHSTLSGNNFSYRSDKNKKPNRVRFAKKRKIWKTSNGLVTCENGKKPGADKGRNAAERQGNYTGKLAEGPVHK